jgi:hypothetical protein
VFYKKSVSLCFSFLWRRKGGALIFIYDNCLATNPPTTPPPSFSSFLLYFLERRGRCTCRGELSIRFNFKGFLATVTTVLKMLANTLLIFVLQILAVSAFTKIPRPKLRTFNWNIGWVNAAPNGFERPFVGINGQWPCPALDLNVGDTIKINAYNGLGNESTAIHFHGIFQHNTAEMDGPAMVTQCPIAPGMSESSRILGSW